MCSGNEVPMYIFFDFFNHYMNKNVNGNIIFVMSVIFAGLGYVVVDDFFMLDFCWWDDRLILHGRVLEDICKFFKL